MKTKHSGTAAEAETELKKGPVYRFLADDHARLDVLLQRAFADPDQIDLHAYSEFRSGLLKHIAIEEKVLLPAAQQAQDGEPLAIAAKLRIQHQAGAAQRWAVGHGVHTPRPSQSGLQPRGLHLIGRPSPRKDITPSQNKGK